MSTFIGMDVNKNKSVEEEQIIASLNKQVNTLTTEKEELVKERDSLNEQVNTLTTEKENLLAEKEKLENQVKELTEKLEKADKKNKEKE